MLPEKKLKLLRRQYVEQHFEEAKDSPGVIAKQMAKKGWYSKNNPHEQNTHHVQNIVTRIKEKGFTFKDKEVQVHSFQKARPRRPRNRKELPGFFPAKSFRPKKEKRSWDGLDTDRAIEFIIQHNWRKLTVQRLARELERTPYSVKRHMQEILYNERGKGALKYKPTKRHSRCGLPFTRFEKKVLIPRHLRDEIPIVVTACILQRKPEEIREDWTGTKKNNRLKDVAPVVDLVLAHRYLYWCAKRPIISDQSYDLLKKEELEFGGGFDLLSEPASSRPCDYPAHIRSLAYYMMFKEEDKKEEPFMDSLPPDFWQHRKKSNNEEPKKPKR